MLVCACVVCVGAVVCCSAVSAHRAASCVPKVGAMDEREADVDREVKRAGSVDAGNASFNPGCCIHSVDGVKLTVRTNSRNNNSNRQQ